ncbi:hypothetical protein EVG20_g10355 [Dentipellis fragilis]|uniref:Uncharacterized protein n=1 Tax=Dentipellis fragilis TaxID=205917 RepID=A0A4Y9XU35_9AGAM|nr:hypothetical protein EVG20_g10355 [Dentipellis fragilis]
MKPADRILGVARARYFLQFWRAHIVRLAAKYPDLISTSRSFISAPSFKILTRICDSMIALILVYGEHYPDIPFCPWILGTAYVEHFFGLARMMLPDFTYSQFLSIVKHVMLRQRILLDKTFSMSSGTQTKRAGYIFDFDNSPLTPEELSQSCIHISRAEIDDIITLGHQEAIQIARGFLHMSFASKHVELAPISGPSATTQDSDSDENDSEDELDIEEQDDIENELESDNEDADCSILLSSMNVTREAALADAHDAFACTVEPSACQTQETPLEAPVSGLSGLPRCTDVPPLVMPTHGPRQSTILSADGLLSIQQVLDMRKRHQSRTTVRSERSVKLDPKFLKRIVDPVFASTLEHTEDGAAEVQRAAMNIREASHRVRIAQALDQATPVSAKKSRELRWRDAARLLQVVVPMHIVPNILERNVTPTHPLIPGSFIIIRNKIGKCGGRIYIGEVLDIYQKGSSSRYGSIESAETTSVLSFISVRAYLPVTMNRGKFTTGDDNDSDSDCESATAAAAAAPSFSCHHEKEKVDLHSHVKAAHLVYNLGLNILAMDDRGEMRLVPRAEKRWLALTASKEAANIVRTGLTIWIPGGKVAQIKSLK